jgi:adenosine deaminase
VAPDRNLTRAVRELTALPKAHLHIHLEGAMRRSTLEELCTAAGVPVPAVTSAKGFAAFIDLYKAACDVLLGPDEMHRLFREVAEDAAADSVVWIEPHVDTTLYVPRLGSHEEVFELFLAAAAEAERVTGVGMGLLMAADRTLDPEIAVVQAELAATRAGDGVVAFGLANDEAGRPAAWFAEAFALARKAGLISAPHAGELAGPESVRSALDALEPHRIGHGVRAVENPPLVDQLAELQVCCDMCPTSNITLDLYPSIDAHPVRRFIDAGVPVTLNADDPLMFGSGIADEYRLVAGLGLDDKAMANIARTSIRFSGMPDHRRGAALAAIDGWLA